MRGTLRSTAAILPLFTGVAVAQDAVRTAVSSDDLRCVLEHAEVYLETTLPIIIIFLDLCPNPIPSSADLAALGRATGVPSTPTLVEGQETTSMLTLTRDQMACLVRLYSGGSLDGPLAGEVINVDAFC